METYSAIPPGHGDTVLDDPSRRNILPWGDFGHCQMSERKTDRRYLSRVRRRTVTRFGFRLLIALGMLAGSKLSLQRILVEMKRWRMKGKLGCHHKGEPRHVRGEGEFHRAMGGAATKPVTGKEAVVFRSTTLLTFRLRGPPHGGSVTGSI
jgi:hypothetical protein